MLYDCLMFNDELDLLEIRLNHHSFVDKFVIIESSRTYSGIPKPYHYQENKQRFAAFHHKIQHIMLDLPFTDNKDWKYEHLQRNVLRGISFELDDIVLYTDVDEILRDEAVVDAFVRSGLNIISLQMELGFYYVNVKVKKAAVPGSTYHIAECFDSKWHMGKILKRHSLYWFPNLYEIRQYDLWNPKRNMIINSGWHFSNIGDPQRIYDKLKAISHCDDPEFQDISWAKICLRMAHLQDPLGRSGVELEVHTDLPKYLINNKDKYGEYFYRPRSK
jgi:beta-1,4-mannosyl-glycoprotein beta-1,4-N-acetylglucosaminyltransferase